MGMEAKGAVRDFEVPSHVAYLSRSATAVRPVSSCVVAFRGRWRIKVGVRARLSRCSVACITQSGIALGRL